MFNAFFQGIYLGLGLVMPLGPLNLFIFNNSSLQRRFMAVLPVVFISGMCDLILILFAVSGVNVIGEIAWFKLILLFVGILFLFYMGIKVWRAPSRNFLEAVPVLSVPKQILYSASLSLLNPHAILDTFIIIGAVSSTFLGLEKQAFTVGCMVSDFAWFSLLALLGYTIHRLPQGPRIFSFIDKISALIMIFLSLQLSIQFVQEMRLFCISP